MKEFSEYNYSENAYSSFSGNNESIPERRKVVSPDVLSVKTWNNILQESLRITTGFESTEMQASDDDACSELIQLGKIDPDSRVGRHMREMQYIDLDREEYELCTLFGEDTDTTDSIYVFLNARTRGEVAAKVGTIAEIELDFRSETCMPCRHNIESVEGNDALFIRVDVLDNNMISYSYDHEEGPSSELSEKFKKLCKRYNVPNDFLILPEEERDSATEAFGIRIHRSAGYMTQSQAADVLSLLEKLNAMNIFN